MYTYRQDERGQWICCAYGERIVAHDFEHMKILAERARRRSEQRQAILKKCAGRYLPRAV